MTKFVHYSQEDDIAIIEMDDAKANAFGVTLIEEMNAALDRATQDARAVAIFGRPGVFSGGFDLKVMTADDQAAAGALGIEGGKLLMRVFGHPQPVVIGATGHSIALGAFFLLTGDYRIGVTGEVKTSLNEAAKGMMLPDFTVELSKARLSPRYLTNALLMSEIYTPEAAVTAGFLDKVVAPDQLRAEVMQQARKLAEFDTENYANIKQAIRADSIAKVAPSLGL